MDVSALKHLIVSKQIPNFLIFAGEEWKVQQIYIDQICKATNKERVYADSFADIYPALKRNSLMADSKVYIVRDDKDIMQNEAVQKQIESGLMRNNILVLLLTAIDKRTRFYKRYSASIIDFERLSDATLKKYIRNAITLSERSVARLIDVCEHDYGRILLEIDKIKRYRDITWLQRDERERDGGIYWTNECFETLLEEGAIHRPPRDAIFDFVDAVLDRKSVQAYDLLDECYECGEATMVMLSVLYNNTKAVLQVQSCDGKDISKTTGLTGWQIKCAKPHVGKYYNGELVAAMRMIQDLESGIKSGKYEEQFVMPYLLAEIL